MAQRPRNLPADERRAATVEAVVELAAEQNPADITTAEIAAHMGVTQGALFRHFHSKDAMLEAVINWVSDRLLARVDRAAARADSPLAALESMFLAHIDFVAGHPGVPRMLFGQLQRAGDTLPKRMASTLMRQYGERLRRLLEQGKKQQELRADLDVDAAAALFLGSIQGLVVQSLISGKPARMRRDAPGVFAIYRRGLTAAAGASEKEQ